MPASFLLILCRRRVIKLSTPPPKMAEEPRTEGGTPPTGTPPTGPEEGSSSSATETPSATPATLAKALEVAEELLQAVKRANPSSTGKQHAIPSPPLCTSAAKLATSVAKPRPKGWSSKPVHTYRPASQKKAHQRGPCTCRGRRAEAACQHSVHQRGPGAYPA